MTLSDLLAVEEILDRALCDWRDLDTWSHAWIEPAHRWAEAVCREADRLGPLAIEPGLRSRGLELAKRPLLVCGFPRSGTTLLRDLLDGHPALCVLPAEGQYFNRPAEDGSVGGDRFAIDWLMRFANPNHQRPFWLLGRSDDEDSPYVHLVRALRAWRLAIREAGLFDSDIAAVALAQASIVGEDLGAKRYWVDKTPGNEFHLKRILLNFPHAWVIQMVRQPAGVYASHAAGQARTGMASSTLRAVLRNLTHSYVSGIRFRRGNAGSGYTTVQYEELVSDREGTMRCLADFLGIPFDDSLLEQTIAGRTAQPNSARSGAPRQDFTPGGLRERFWFAAARLTRWGLIR